MTTKTKDQAIAQYRSLYAGLETPFFVYQFPKGHWGYATPASPVGRSLVETGYIYPDQGIKATTFELIPT